MFPVTKFTRQVLHLKPLLPALILTTHTKTCPTKKKIPRFPKAKTKLPKGPTKGVCPGDAGGAGSSKPTLKRGVPGKVRLGLIPEEWFLFFHSKTGVTGPYLFGIMLTNYLVSKEKYVMDHEYYLGLSMFIIMYYVSTVLGPTIGGFLDKEVDAVAESYEKTRRDEIASYENEIKQGKEAQWKAEGQKLLMDAKKENVAMQLEAVYRERWMHAYRTVKGRMDYQVKVYRAQARIQQKWMLEWILSNVKKSITPELEQQALQRAIEDLAAVSAGRAK